MCGIAGFQGTFDRELLLAMGSALSNRGPDGEGVVLFAGHDRRVPAGFAHRRLAIIDLSECGHQPMTTVCPACGSRSLGDLALTYNGEIYNYRELWADLSAAGHVRRSTSDSEVLIHAYAQFGLEAPTRLNGIFAFAIRDCRAGGRPPGVEPGDIFIVRDQLGVKPLYYSETSSGLLFASELKALLLSAEVPRDLDLIALHQTLAYLWTPSPRTVLRDVKKLEPGGALLVRGGAIARSWRYYDLPYGRTNLEGSESDIAAELRGRVQAAVQRQLVADVRVGAFLSGGLDSSAVVAMMRHADASSRIACYGIGFRDDSGLDGNPPDMPYARRVAQQLGVELNEITVTESIIERIDDVLYALDEPQADPAPINVLLISEQARRDGLKVLLSGAGGDDLFSGYQRHRAITAERLWMHLPHAVRRGMAAMARRRALGAGPAYSAPWQRRVVKLLEHVDLDDDRRLVAYFWWSGEQMRRGLYSSDFARAVSSDDAAAPLLESLARIPNERDPLNRMLYLEAKHFLADHNLNYTDKMGMAAGVEIRVPLLDVDLVDFATRIPSAMKQRRGTGKAVFKRSMEGILPRDVIYRAKTGFGAPLRRWLRHELRDRVESTLSPAALAARGLFDPKTVQRLIELDRSGRVDGAYTIFSLMCIELWCRRFLDGLTS